MTETKMALMERLRKERRWEEADRFREETRRRLKSEGKRRREAADEAWELTAEKFPPLATPAAAGPSTAIASEANKRDLPDVVSTYEGSVDFSQLLQWTVRNIASNPDSLRPEQMPYPACREMLRWARTEPKNFWPYVAKFNLRSNEQADQQRKFEDDKRKHFKLFDKLIEYWEQHPEADETALVYPPPSQTSGVA